MLKRTLNILTLILLLALPAAVRAQFTFTTNNGVLTITGYTGSGGTVTIPASINSLPVTSLADNAFGNCTNLTNIIIPDSVTSIGNYAFYGCTSLASATLPGSLATMGAGVFYSCSSLTSVTLPNSMTSIGNGAFFSCLGLTNITTPNSITNIENFAFFQCISLTRVTIPHSVTSVGDGAFASCFNLNEIFFSGNAPNLGGSSIFNNTPDVTVYYLPGATGWDTIFSGRPLALWLLPNPAILSFEPAFGIQTNRFGFTISWATNVPVVVEACTNLGNPDWQPLQTNALVTGSVYFSDPQWTNFVQRFYRVRSP